MPAGFFALHVRAPQLALYPAAADSTTGTQALWYLNATTCTPWDRCIGTQYGLEPAGVLLDMATADLNADGLHDLVFVGATKVGVMRCVCGVCVGGGGAA